MVTAQARQQPDIKDDLAYQEAILQGVSRTFALTIPQLPEGLRTAAGNAYLLCRIADTIEDSDALTLEEKKRFYAAFVETVAGNGSAEDFGCDLAPLLRGGTSDAERDLVRNTPRVVRITHSFGPDEQAALTRCLRIMSRGMEEFQEGNFAEGLRDLEHLDAYCYHVAGVVGEMLTDLFCAHSAGVAKHRATLSRLAVSFGQGLQMTNILKDLWDDKSRDVCWLPRAVFAQHGFDLRTLSKATNDGESFEAGLVKLIAVALGHLEHALDYTLLIPKSEKGIRKFCLWAIGMAVLTLRRINRNRSFTSAKEVKISRRGVKATMLATRLLGFSDTLLRALFRLAALGLPRDPPAVTRSYA